MPYKPSTEDVSFEESQDVVLGAVPRNRTQAEAVAEAEAEAEDDQPMDLSVSVVPIPRAPSGDQKTVRANLLLSPVLRAPPPSPASCKAGPTTSTTSASASTSAPASTNMKRKLGDYKRFADIRRKLNVERESLETDVANNLLSETEKDMFLQQYWVELKEEAGLGEEGSLPPTSTSDAAPPIATPTAASAAAPPTATPTAASAAALPTATSVSASAAVPSTEHGGNKLPPPVNDPPITSSPILKRKKVAHGAEEEARLQGEEEKILHQLAGKLVAEQQEASKQASEVTARTANIKESTSSVAQESSPSPSTGGHPQMTDGELRMRAALRAVQAANTKKNAAGTVKDLRAKTCGDVLVKLNDSYALGRGMHSYRRGQADATFEAIKFIRIPQEKDGEEKKPVVIAVSLRCLPQFQKAIRDILNSGSEPIDPAQVNIWELPAVGGVIDASSFTQAVYARTKYLIDTSDKGVEYAVMVDDVHYSTGKSMNVYESLRIMKTSIGQQDKKTEFALNFPVQLIPAIDRVLTDFVAMGR